MDLFIYLWLLSNSWSEMMQQNDNSVFHPDTKTTQWEDPRLQSPAITGPVSRFLLQAHLLKTSP